jgi:pimeloyl-ACP methyl ester carboxylesterase
MQGFERKSYKVNGVETVLYEGGKGKEPLMFLHGGGTFHGFEFVSAWTDKFRVLHPYHPGYGESGDDPEMNELQDYVLHYDALLDLLKIEKINLVGFSLGGWIAAKFAIAYPNRVKKLALVGPAGFRDKDHPTADILGLPGEQLPGMLVSNFDVIKKWLPEGPPPMDFIAARYRESTTFARLFWERPWDAKLPRYLHRVTMPTLILWGDEDRIVPVEQHKHWKKFLPKADIKIIKGAGHLVLDEKPEAAKAVASFMSG